MSVSRLDNTPRQNAKREKRSKKRLSSGQCARAAYELMERERHKEAREFFYKALEGRSPSASCFLGLALCEMALGNPSAAKEAVIRLTQRTIRKARLRAHAEKVESYLEDFPELREVFYEVILEQVRNSALVFLGLARCHARQGKWDKAQRVLLEAVGAKGLAKHVLSDLKSVLKVNRSKKGLSYVRKYEQGKIGASQLVELLSGGRGERRKLDSSVFGEADSLGRMVGNLEAKLGVGKESVEEDREIYVGVQVFLARVEPIVIDAPKTRMDLALGLYLMGLVEVAQEELRRIPKEANCFLTAPRGDHLNTVTVVSPLN